jgi:CHAT domain-containing protein
VSKREVDMDPCRKAKLQSLATTKKGKDREFFLSIFPELHVYVSPLESLETCLPIITEVHKVTESEILKIDEIYKDIISSTVIEELLPIIIEQSSSPLIQRRLISFLYSLRKLNKLSSRELSTSREKFSNLVLAPIDTRQALSKKPQSDLLQLPIGQPELQQIVSQLSEINKNDLLEIQDGFVKLLTITTYEKKLELIKQIDGLLSFRAELIIDHILEVAISENDKTAITATLQNWLFLNILSYKGMEAGRTLFSTLSRIDQKSSIEEIVDLFNQLDVQGLNEIVELLNWHLVFASHLGDQNRSFHFFNEIVAIGRLIKSHEEHLDRTFLSKSDLLELWSDFFIAKSIFKRFELINANPRMLSKAGLTQIDYLLQKSFEPRHTLSWCLQRSLIIDDWENLTQNVFPESSEIIKFEQKIVDFINANSWEDGKRIILEYPKLTHSFTNTFLFLLIFGNTGRDPKQRENIINHLEVIKECQESNINEAFEKIEFPKDVSVPSKDAINQLLAQESNEALQKFIDDNPDTEAIANQLNLLVFSEEEQVKYSTLLQRFVEAGSYPKMAAFASNHESLRDPEEKKKFLEYLEFLSIDQQINLSEEEYKKFLNLISVVKMVLFVKDVESKPGASTNMLELIPLEELNRELVTFPKSEQKVIQEKLLELGRFGLDLEISQDRELALQVLLGKFEKDQTPLFWSWIRMLYGQYLYQVVMYDEGLDPTRAIQHLEDANSVLTYQKYPLIWASNQRMLGLLYSRQASLDNSSNFEKAIDAIEVAKTVFIKDQRFAQWLELERSHAGILFDQYRTTQDLKILGKSIELVREVIDEINKEDYPEEWARLWMNLGVFYRHKNMVADPKDFDTVNESFSNALEAVTKNSYPKIWAEIKINQGNNYQDQAKFEDIYLHQKAIDSFKDAMNVFTKDKSPYWWAAINASMGEAYMYTPVGNMGENYEIAIKHLTASLEIYSKEKYPTRWANTQFSLGLIYHDRVLGDLVENWEQALMHLKNASSGYVSANSPQLLQVQIVTAAHYHTNPKGNILVNLNRTILELEKNQAGLHLYPNLPAISAISSWLYLSEFYYMRAKLFATARFQETSLQESIQSDINKAIAAMDNVDLDEVQKTSPNLWISSAVLQAELIQIAARFDDEIDIRKAKKIYEDLLQKLSFENNRLKWIKTQLRHGQLLQELFDKTGDTDYLQEVTYSYKTVIESSKIFGSSKYEIYGNNFLGEVLNSIGQLEEAHDHFVTAYTLANSQREEFIYESSISRLSFDNLLVNENLLDSNIDLGKNIDAFNVSESAKSRLLLHQFGLSEYPKVFLPKAISSSLSKLLLKEKDLLDQVRMERHFQRILPPFLSRRNSANFLDNIIQNQLERFSPAEKNLSSSRQVNEIYKDLRDVWAEVGLLAPAYAEQRHPQPATFAQIKSLLENLQSNVAIVQLYKTKNRIVALILREGASTPIVHELQITSRKFQFYVDLFQKEIQEYPLYGDTGYSWDVFLQSFFEEILVDVSGAKVVYIIPHQELHFLPLHAIRVNNEFLFRKVPLAYSPSSTVLNFILNIKNNGMYQKAKVFGFTPNPDEKNLFLGEAEKIANLLDAELFLDSKASKRALYKALAKPNYIHFSCHGIYDAVDPNRSSLQLSDGQLSVLDILNLKLDTDLITLSACESGLGVKAGDEVINFPGAFLLAGASSVLSTLWQVNPESSMHFMENFYNQLGQGSSKTEATKAAMDASVDRYNHPYHWAAFTLNGSWK